MSTTSTPIHSNQRHFTTEDRETCRTINEKIMKTRRNKGQDCSSRGKGRTIKEELENIKNYTAILDKTESTEKETYFSSTNKYNSYVITKQEGDEIESSLEFMMHTKSRNNVVSSCNSSPTKLLQCNKSIETEVEETKSIDNPNEIIKMDESKESIETPTTENNESIDTDMSKELNFLVGQLKSRSSELEKQINISFQANDSIQELEEKVKNLEHCGKEKELYKENFESVSEEFKKLNELNEELERRSYVLETNLATSFLKNDELEKQVGKSSTKEDHILHLGEQLNNLIEQNEDLEMNSCNLEMKIIASSKFTKDLNESYLEAQEEISSLIGENNLKSEIISELKLNLSECELKLKGANENMNLEKQLHQKYVKEKESKLSQINEKLIDNEAMMGAKYNEIYEQLREKYEKEQELKLKQMKEKWSEETKHWNKEELEKVNKELEENLQLCRKELNESTENAIVVTKSMEEKGFDAEKKIQVLEENQQVQSKENTFLKKELSDLNKELIGVYESINVSRNDMEQNINFLMIEKLNFEHKMREQEESFLKEAKSLNEAKNFAEEVRKDAVELLGYAKTTIEELEITEKELEQDRKEKVRIIKKLKEELDVTKGELHDSNIVISNMKKKDFIQESDKDNLLKHELEIRKELNKLKACSANTEVNLRECNEVDDISNSILRCSFEELEQICNVEKKLNQTLLQDIETLQVQIQDLLASKRDQEILNNTLQQELKTCSESMTKLETNINDSNEQIQYLQVLTELEESSSTSFVQELNACRKELMKSKLTAERSNKEEEKTLLEAYETIQGMETNQTNYKGLIKEQGKTLMGIKEELKLCRQDLIVSKKNSHYLSKQVQDMELKEYSLLEKNQREKKLMEKNVELMESKRNEIEREIVELKKLLKNHENQNKSLQQKLENIGTSNHLDLSGKETIIKTLENEKRLLEEELVKLNETNMNNNETKETLIATMRKEKEQVKELTVHNMAAKVTVIATLEEEKQQLKESKIQFQEEHTHMKESIKNIQNTFCPRVISIELIPAEIRVLRDGYNSTKVQLKEKSSILQSTFEEYERMKEDVSNLTNKLHVADIKIKSGEMRIQKTKEEISKLISDDSNSNMKKEKLKKIEGIEIANDKENKVKNVLKLEVCNDSVEFVFLK